MKCYGNVIVTESISINATYTSVSRFKQLEQAVPASVISFLSSGEFAGIIADNVGEEIALKAFHCRVINDHKSLAKEAAAFQPTLRCKHFSNHKVQRMYHRVKEDIENEMEAILNDPSKNSFVVSKN